MWAENTWKCMAVLTNTNFDKHSNDKQRVSSLCSKIYTSLFWDTGMEKKTSFSVSHKQIETIHVASHDIIYENTFNYTHNDLRFSYQKDLFNGHLWR